MTINRSNTREITELIRVKDIQLDTCNGKVILSMEVLDPFPIEKIDNKGLYYVAVGEYGPDKVEDFNT